MKPLCAILCVVSLSHCTPRSSTKDAGAAAAAVDPTSQLAAMQALNDAMDRVLRQLPAARDEAQDVVNKLNAARKAYGEDKARKLMEGYKGQPVPQSPTTKTAFDTVVVVNQKWDALRLGELAAQGPDAGPLGLMAANMKQKSQLLKTATVLLEEIDKARFELGILSSSDGGTAAQEPAK